MAKSGSENETDGDSPDDKNSKKGVKPKETVEDSVIVLNKTPKVSTPISILIESLVKNLCSVYETDNKKAKLMYKLICDKLYKMHLIDESYQMNEFESIRSQYENAFFHLLTSAKGGKLPISLQPHWPDQNINNSHYYREFEEVEFIAGGGFGRVYRVKHKLDGTEYAIKKIPIRSEGLQSIKNYLSEVKTFASVNHPNIVQYKAAWLDMGDSQHSNLDYENDLQLESYYSSKAKTHSCHINEEYIYHQDEILSFVDKGREDSSDFEIIFEHSINSLESHRSLSNRSERKSIRREKRDSISEGGKAICPLDYKEIDQIRNRQRLQEKWATLYIQMALCQLTLKQWLAIRNCTEPLDPKSALVPLKVVNNDTVKEILRQLLKGLQYIHSKGIVHHDIKPSNIFVQMDNGKLLVQLGDFGLACPLQSVRHSLAFGTKLYAAPEQLAGECNSKSDMYSLGIVLFELVETFITDMERNKSIEELKKQGFLPSRIIIQHPQFASIIVRLVAKSPHQRPDAYELLKSITQNEGSCAEKQIQELKTQLAEKDEEIARLKDLLKSHGLSS